MLKYGRRAWQKSPYFWWNFEGAWKRQLIRNHWLRTVYVTLFLPKARRDGQVITLHKMKVVCTVRISFRVNRWRKCFASWVLKGFIYNTIIETTVPVVDSRINCYSTLITFPVIQQKSATSVDNRLYLDSCLICVLNGDDHDDSCLNIFFRR